MLFFHRAGQCDPPLLMAATPTHVQPAHVTAHETTFRIDRTPCALAAVFSLFEKKQYGKLPKDGTPDRRYF